MDAKDRAPNGDFAIVPVGDRLVVRVTDESLLRIDPLRNLLRSQKAYPLLFSGAAGGQPWVNAWGTLRRASTVPIANFPLQSGDEKIMSQPDEFGLGRQVIEVASSPETGDGTHRLEFFSAKSTFQA